MLTETTTSQDGATQPRKVLVVDDEYGPRESIAYTLATSFSVETAERAAEALKKIKDQHFHVVVLDIRMPEMDGIKALEELRKIDPHVSVIILTGYGMLSTAQQAMVGGANQYMRKPPDVAELIDAVRHQAEAAQLRRHQAKMSADAILLNAALKKEIDSNQPQIWQARASVELVHDLNNPLTVVIGYSALMVEEAHKLAEQNPEMGRRMADYAVIVEKAAEYCHHLSENWRTASKKMAEFTIIDLVAVAFEVKQVIFFGSPVVQISGTTEAWINGSKYEIMRVFQNLLKNSIESGASRVSVDFSAKGTKATATITDNGPGMDEDRIHRAMHGGFTSKENGTGLGLSICRHLTASHGGEFAIESEPGVGTTVKLTFPALERK
ncbi:MAG TPA: response regulator [Opitutaceae bacterium]|jgi:signal transduction histidine kinase|nr:response regulator [Opitutaceae bacterium]